MSSNKGNTGGAKSGGGGGKMTQDDASRIQSTQGGKDMSSGGFSARAQSAGDKNANAGSK
ncbi:hypothetical protein GMOD_00001503 [Pyrenophora seminiperda CCB06]|uniref:SMP domain-containing protein n=1 Tax=Pyrenophora seminiperda CCB06 TaxID=1302712 RepID=A0A3M7LZD1_9PLEO|nr:hypothetical protein GMOD_00001503 [Pyrenophora seminiperda CCB06]